METLYFPADNELGYHSAQFHSHLTQDLIKQGWTRAPVTKPQAVVKEKDKAEVSTVKEPVKPVKKASKNVKSI